MVVAQKQARRPEEQDRDPKNKPTVMRSVNSQEKDKNLPTRLSCHPLHVVFGHISGFNVLRIQHAEHGQGPQVVAVNFIPAGAVLLGIPGREVLQGAGQHGVHGLSEPGGNVLVGAGSPELELGHLCPGEVQHWMAVVVGIHKGNHDFWVLVGDVG